MEKKLTDEEIAKEIVKALEDTKKSLEDLNEENDDYDKLSLVKKINNSSLWLIQRQKDIIQKQCELYEKLEQDYGEQVEMNSLQAVDLARMSDKLIELEVETNEQKAEIEQLTEEVESIANIHVESCKNCYKSKQVNVLEGHIKELKECHEERLSERQKVITALCDEKRELQKQVDELKEEFSDLFGRAYQYYIAAQRGGFPFYDEQLEPKCKEGNTIQFPKFEVE